MSLKYIRLYPQDYLQDTNHLNTEEHGAYLLLIINYWQTEKPLKDDDKRLAGICRMPSDRWLEIRPTLEEFFDLADGLWRHNRIEHELFLVDSKSEQARAAGRKGGIKKAENKRLSSETVADAKRPSSDTDTDTNTNIKTKIKTRARFAPPSVQEVTDYCQSRNNNIDPEVFVDHYQANGWMRGNNKIKCWKSCVRTWEKSPRRHENPKRQIGDKTNERLRKEFERSRGEGSMPSGANVSKLVNS